MGRFGPSEGAMSNRTCALETENSSFENAWKFFGCFFLQFEDPSLDESTIFFQYLFLTKRRRNDQLLGMFHEMSR